MEIRFIEFLSSIHKGDYQAIFTSGRFTHRQGTPLLLFMRLVGSGDGTELMVVVVRVVLVVVVVQVVVKEGGSRGDVGEELFHKQRTEKFQKYKTLITQVSKLLFKIVYIFYIDNLNNYKRNLYGRRPVVFITK